MAKDTHTLFHETWLGEAQPLEGLTFSVPVLVDGGVMQRLSAAEARELDAYLAEAQPEAVDDEGEGDDEASLPSARLTSLRGFLLGFCGWTEDELHGEAELPEDLELRIAEEGTQLRPTLAIAHGAELDAPESEPETPTPLSSGEQTPATRAGAAYQLLAWELPAGLDLDVPESETTQWHYPPTAKLERLLRETRVPMGLLCNGETLRLMYCPPGQATGWISFCVDYMATPAGRDMLSAARELLHADRVMGGLPDTPTTLELLAQSRERQADVTTRLGEQVLEALQILLAGFEAAAVRDGDAALREAMDQAGNHVYEGLLTVMLRLIFVLYAEDRGLLPVEHPAYAAHSSVGGLYDELVADADAWGDTMDQRFGAWPRLVMLFRALYFGLEFRAPDAPALSMPPHRGRLFNPENFAFLEGETPAGGAPVSPDDRARVRLPSISDAVVHRVLRRLLLLQGQRLSYGALDEEHLGGVYEDLIGYRVERRMAPSVCLAPSRVWVSPGELLDQPRATRVRYLQDLGVSASPAKRLAKAVATLEGEHGEDSEALGDAVLATLREFSVRRRRRGGKSREQLAAEVGAERLVIQPGEERRRTSSHYTPPELSKPIVARTLEPLLAAMRAKAVHERPDDPDPQPRAAELLRLKVCDPAMGSGAFLVESCRFLAKQLVAAWIREGTLEELLAKADDEAARRNPEQLALRMVAQGCIYGVDKNPLAVELGKLSLWLLTYARGQTFTFMDHCLKAGDSLVGLSKAQIFALDWGLRVPEGKGKKTKKKGKKRKTKKAAQQVQLDLFAGQAERAFAKAMKARQALAALARSSDRDAIERRQHELHVDAERALERVRDVADVLLSSYFWPIDESKDKEANKLAREFLFDGKKVSAKARKACLARVKDQLNIWLGDASEPRLPWNLELRRTLVRECIRPMHWELEFPEVFTDEREDPLAEDGVGKVWMDAVVGNPPFMAGKKISSNYGDSYAAWLGDTFRSNRSSDISALFFRRAHGLLGVHGTLGLIATNTISEGDTREAGLQALVQQGARIFDARTSLKWPVPGANVSVSVVHVATGLPADLLTLHRLDGEEVGHINSQLSPKPERQDPVRIVANAGLSFQGAIVLGKGFVLDDDEREALIEHDARNAERIFPYLGGQELNSSPSQSPDRWVISFWDFDLDKASQWPDLLDIVRERVKPDRDKQKRKALRERWWQYADKRPGLYRTIEPLEHCLACSIHSKHLIFAFQPTDRIFSHALIVLALPRHAQFGLLQSRVHEHWVRLQGSSMRNDLRYTPSDCFETFPFPDPEHLAEDTPLDILARELYETRAAYMLATDQGLTKTYNALKDPDEQTPELDQLRRLHEQLDRAVLDAYGQTAIEVPPYVGASPEQLERFEDAVLDFLYARNAKLAAAEAKAQARSKS